MWAKPGMIPRAYPNRLAVSQVRRAQRAGTARNSSPRLVMFTVGVA